MDVFGLLLVKLIPLYFLIGMGFIAGCRLALESRNLAGTMIYLITPLVILSGSMRAELSVSVLLLPPLIFVLCCLNSLLFLFLGKALLTDSRANILSLSVGTANTGYFGIPVAAIIFGEQGAALYIVAMMGTTLFENSVGFYIAAKGAYPARDCLLKVLRLPSLYAFFIGISLNLSGIHTPMVVDDFFADIRGAYTVFGMMIIGLGMAFLRVEPISYRFIWLIFVGKFLSWPVLAFLFITFDTSITQIFSGTVHQVIMLISVMPVAANTVVIAALLNIHPHRVATAAFGSTFFALLYIPFMVSVFSITG